MWHPGQGLDTQHIELGLAHAVHRSDRPGELAVDGLLSLSEARRSISLLGPPTCCAGPCTQRQRFFFFFFLDKDIWVCATGEAPLGILETNWPNGTLKPHPVTARGFLVQADCLADCEAQIQQGRPCTSDLRPVAAFWQVGGKPGRKTWFPIVAAGSTWLEEEILGHRLSLFLLDGGKATGKDLPCESQHHLQGWCPFLSPWPLSCDLLGNGFQIRAGRRFRTWMVLKTINPMRKATFRKSPFFSSFIAILEGTQSKFSESVCLHLNRPMGRRGSGGPVRQLRIAGQSWVVPGAEGTWNLCIWDASSNRGAQTWNPK